MFTTDDSEIGTPLLSGPVVIVLEPVHDLFPDKNKPFCFYRKPVIESLSFRGVAAESVFGWKKSKPDRFFGYASE